jgi:hypothetical protein
MTLVLMNYSDSRMASGICLLGVKWSHFRSGINWWLIGYQAGRRGWKYLRVHSRVNKQVLLAESKALGLGFVPL